MEIIIRHEEARDHQQVREILLEAFPTDAESKLVDVMRENGKAVISLVAVKGETVVGHILFSPVSTTPHSDSKGIGLAPLAVRTAHRSQGVGSQLCREGLRFCRELQYDFSVVFGAPEYYGRFGYKKASDFDLQNEYGVDDEFMVVHFSGNRPHGLVKYATEFLLFSV